MTMPSNKWEEAVRDTLVRLLHECDHEPDEITKYVVIDQTEFVPRVVTALTNAVRELVKETMPEPTSAFDGSEAQVFIIATDQYQANLLKAIGDTSE